MEVFPPRGKRDTHKIQEVQNAYKTYKAPPQAHTISKQLPGRSRFFSRAVLKLHREQGDAIFVSYRSWLMLG